MDRTRRLIDCYLPPGEGFLLESFVATTYQVDFEFFEEELLAAALGVRSPVSRQRAFRSELERRLQKCEVSVLYDLAGCEKLARLSPRIDAVPIVGRKLHSKISLLMWIRENAASGAPPDRRLRLIVGSANLTRQGFRHNYECVVSVDLGGRSTSPRSLLTTAITLVQNIGAELQAPQFKRQLAAFVVQAAKLPEGTAGTDDPVAMVSAEEVVPSIQKTWTTLSSKAPETATIVSPFWPEGTTAAEGLAQLFEQLGSPANVELICRGEKSGDGKAWLPVFDSSIAVELRKRLPSRLFLRATLPDRGFNGSTESSDDSGDELEEKELAAKIGTEGKNAAEAQRALHAKMILLDGTGGSVLYVGSSNCTRRGLALGGAANHEAGLVYQLSPRQRKQIAALLEFAGPASEVVPDSAPATVQPPKDDELPVPTFLAEVVASGSVIAIRFRDIIPSDLRILMPIPTKAGGDSYWLLYQPDPRCEPPPQSVTVDLANCPICDKHLAPLVADATQQMVVPHVFVEVRWEGNSASFPVRFDDKAQLPLLLVGRKATEGELIDYFLFGREPDDGDGGSGLPGDNGTGPQTDSPIDTRRILAYFIRRFVQAIAGIEAELDRAAYSRASLDAALRGPTSPLELAERAYASLKEPPKRDEPPKTPTAVGFQLTEILAAIGRSRARISDTELLACFAPVEARCRDLLETVSKEHAELQSDAFRRYRDQILGGGQ
jgi:hypothetical protein